MTGLRAAEHAEDALNEQRRALWKRIAATPARTAEGMLAKVAFVAPLFETADRDGEGDAENILASVAVDYGELHPVEG